MEMVLIKVGGIVAAFGLGALLWWARPHINAWIDRIPGNPEADQ